MVRNIFPVVSQENYVKPQIDIFLFFVRINNSKQTNLWAPELDYSICS